MNNTPFNEGLVAYTDVFQKALDKMTQPKDKDMLEAFSLFLSAAGLGERLQSIKEKDGTTHLASFDFAGGVIEIRFNKDGE